MLFLGGSCTGLGHGLRLPLSCVTCCVLYGAAEPVKAGAPVKDWCVVNCYRATAELLESLEDRWRNDYPDNSRMLSAPSGKAITVSHPPTGQFQIQLLNPKMNSSELQQRSLGMSCSCPHFEMSCSRFDFIPKVSNVSA